jgi:hypothetical protein
LLKSNPQATTQGKKILGQRTTHKESILISCPYKRSTMLYTQVITRPLNSRECSMYYIRTHLMNSSISWSY